MHLDTKESRQAHTETGSRDYVAASSPSPLASSPAPALRDPQLSASRGVAESQQPFPPRSIRHVPPIPAELLRRIFEEDRELNRGAIARLSSPAPTWTDIAIAAVAVAALVMFLFFLDGGWIA